MTKICTISGLTTSNQD